MATPVGSQHDASSWRSENNPAVRQGTSAVVGIALILIGGLFALQQATGLNVWRMSWPFFVMLPGLGLFALMILGGRSAGFLAIPASIVTTVGAILLYQNTFHHFESWSYAWALVAPTSVGAGMWIQAHWMGTPALEAAGLRLMRIGLVLFAAFAVFFELLLNISHVGALSGGRLFGPLLLIALGVALLLRQRDRGTV